MLYNFIWVRIRNILIAIDQLLWVLITLGSGHPDETISSATYRYEKAGSRWAAIARPIIDMLFFWEKQHCRRAYLAEIFRKNQSESERKMAGKGSKQRPMDIDTEKFDENWDVIFGGKNQKHKQQNMTELNADGNRERGRSGEDLDAERE